MSKALTRKEWLAYLDQAIKEFDWDAAHYDTPPEPAGWAPDRSGKYLTVVYRDLIAPDEVGPIVEHYKCVRMSWSDALEDVDQLKRMAAPRPWVGLKDSEYRELLDLTDYYNFPEDLITNTMAKLREKNDAS